MKVLRTASLGSNFNGSYKKVYHRILGKTSLQSTKNLPLDIIAYTAGIPRFGVKVSFIN